MAGRCVECARILIEAGADPDAADPDGVAGALGRLSTATLTSPPADQAGGRPEPCRHLRPNAALLRGRLQRRPASNRPAPNVFPDRASSLDLIKVLLDRGANPNARLKKQQPYRTKVDRGNDTMLGAGTTPSFARPRPADWPRCACSSGAGADPKLATGSDTVSDVSAPNRSGGAAGDQWADGRRRALEREKKIRPAGARRRRTPSTRSRSVSTPAQTSTRSSNGRTALHGAAKKDTTRS